MSFAELLPAASGDASGDRGLPRASAVAKTKLRRGDPSVFCWRMALSPNTSAPDGICSPRPHTGKR